jgi:hypothetical protein
VHAERLDDHDATSLRVSNQEQYEAFQIDALKKRAASNVLQ